MPVDAEPVDDGNVLLAQSGAKRFICGVWISRGEVVARVLKKGETADEGRPRRVSHFATCPQSKGWRR